MDAHHLVHGDRQPPAIIREHHERGALCLACRAGRGRCTIVRNAEQPCERHVNDDVAAHTDHADPDGSAAMRQRVRGPRRHDLVEQRHRNCQPLGPEAEDEARCRRRVLHFARRGIIRGRRIDRGLRDRSIESRSGRRCVRGAVAAVRVLRELRAASVAGHADHVPAVFAFGHCAANVWKLSARRARIRSLLASAASPRFSRRSARWSSASSLVGSRKSAFL